MVGDVNEKTGILVDVGEWEPRPGPTAFGPHGIDLLPWLEVEGDGVLEHTEALQVHDDGVQRFPILNGLWNERNDERLRGAKAI
jgi:hypothetical protein